MICRSPRARPPAPLGTLSPWRQNQLKAPKRKHTAAQPILLNPPAPFSVEWLHGRQESLLEAAITYQIGVPFSRQMRSISLIEMARWPVTPAGPPSSGVEVSIPTTVSSTLRMSGAPVLPGFGAASND